MPMVKFPYTKEGEKNAKAAAREYSGKYISDKNLLKQLTGRAIVVKKLKPIPFVFKSALDLSLGLE